MAVNPVAQTPQPKARRSVPKHWSPEEARHFLALIEGDRTWTASALLLGSGLRIGELVARRWPNVDLEAKVVRVVELSTYVGHDAVPSAGKIRDAIRSIDLDDGLVKVLRAQRRQQAAEQLGHSDPSLFMNLYSHVTPTMQREAAEKIGAALFGER